MCYGRDLARGTMVTQVKRLVILPQSIGEPAQLTMQLSILAVLPRWQQSFGIWQDGKIEFENATTLKNASGDTCDGPS